MADMASELEAIAFRLRRAGEEDLPRELAAALRRGVDPVRDDIRAGLKPKLPDRYAEVLDADLKLSVSVRNSGGDASASVVGTTRGIVQRRRLRRLDRGVLEHPAWGDREHWYAQDVKPGWFTGPAQAAAPRIRGEFDQALRDVRAKAEGR
jgi:hypothetical protein